MESNSMEQAETLGGSGELEQENIMGTMPIGKLLISMSLPMIFSMLVQSLYNIVDSMFVARLAEDALTAVTLAMPLQSVMTAITIREIQVPEHHRLVYMFHDGHTKEITWQNPYRRESWTEEMRQKARERRLEYLAERRKS